MFRSSSAASLASFLLLAAAAAGASGPVVVPAPGEAWRIPAEQAGVPCPGLHLARPDAEFQVQLPPPGMPALVGGYVLDAEPPDPGRALVLRTQAGWRCGRPGQPLVVPEAGLHLGWAPHVDPAAPALPFSLTVRPHDGP
jgi:hypothetical protein